jgi:2-phospho-L-lactate guanylyltransferase (CobY/MobA/RfbA family)
VSAGLARVDGHALVVNADVPCATPEALRRLAGAGLALVEALDGTTNALSLPDPAVFAPLYGAGSAERFRSHAPFETVSIPELEADVDTDEDLTRLAALVGPRTRALLAVPA